MNQLMYEYGLNTCSFYVVDSVNSHVTYGVHVAVIGVDYPRTRGLVCPYQCRCHSMYIVRMPARGGFWSTRSSLMGRNIGRGSLLSRSGSTSWCLGSQRGSMAGWCLRWSWRQRRRWSGHMYWPWLWWHTRCRLCVLCLGEWRKDWCVVIVLSVRWRCLCSWASCKIGPGCDSSLFDDSGDESAHGKLSRWRGIIDGTILPQEFTVAQRSSPRPIDPD